MHKDTKRVRPFGLEFIEAIPDAELANVTGGDKKAHTLALSIATHGPKDVTQYDEY